VWENDVLDGLLGVLKANGRGRCVVLECGGKANLFSGIGL